MTGVIISLLNRSIGTQKKKVPPHDKVITVTVNNTRSPCLYDFNSTDEFPAVCTALCYDTVDWEEREQWKPELAIMSLEVCTLLSTVLSVCL